MPTTPASTISLNHLEGPGKNADGTEMAVPFDLSTMDWKQNAATGITHDASSFQIVYGGSANLSMKGGNAQSAATVYAPNASFTMTGTQDFFGSILAKTITNGGNASIHYDRRLGRDFWVVGHPMMAASRGNATERSQLSCHKMLVDVLRISGSSRSRRLQRSRRHRTRRRRLIDRGSGHLLDDGSTDRTIALVERSLGRGVLGIERLADTVTDAVPAGFEWERILLRKTQLAAELDANWFIHHDADEFRESPWPHLSLHDAIRWVDSLGFNAIDFSSLDFWPVHDAFRAGDDVRHAFTFYAEPAPHDRIQIRRKGR
jgi:hypothetical protein